MIWCLDCLNLFLATYCVFLFHVICCCWLWASVVSASLQTASQSRDLLSLHWQYCQTIFSPDWKGGLCTFCPPDVSFCVHYLLSECSMIIKDCSTISKDRQKYFHLNLLSWEGDFKNFKILIRAPEMPCLVPPKWLKRGVLAFFGVLEMAFWVPGSKF